MMALSLVYSMTQGVLEAIRHFSLDSAVCAEAGKQKITSSVFV